MRAGELLRRRRDVLLHRDQPLAAFAHPIVEVALLLLAGRRKLLKDLLFLVSLLGQLVAHGEAVHLGRQQAQAGAGRELVELLAHGLDLADHLEALLQALLAGLIGRERRLEAGNVGLGGGHGGLVFGLAMGVDRRLQGEVFRIERLVGGREGLAVDLGFQAPFLGEHAVEPLAARDLLRLGEGGIERRQHGARPHEIADPDFDRADHRGLERLHDDERIDRDQLAAGDDHPVDPGEGGPQGRAKEERCHQVDDAARRARQRPLLDHRGIGLEREGRRVDAFGGGRVFGAYGGESLGHRNDLLCLSHSCR